MTDDTRAPLTAQEIASAFAKNRTALSRMLRRLADESDMRVDSNALRAAANVLDRYEDMRSRLAEVERERDEPRARIVRVADWYEDIDGDTAARVRSLARTEETTQ